MDPLRKLLTKNVEFHWSKQCSNSFIKTKEYLYSAPAPVIFNEKAPIYLFTEASGEGNL